jgi:hypothetical protein
MSWKCNIKIFSFVTQSILATPHMHSLEVTSLAEKARMCQAIVQHSASDSRAISDAKFTHV